MDESTGFIDFSYAGETYQTWYKVVGNLKSGIRPLVTLHGGPGMSHVYMISHTELFVKHGIPVVFYDQLGIGASTHLPNKSPDFWTVGLFMDELDNVLDNLGIAGDFDLLGHSWGGMLAADYASSRHPPGLHRLVISSAPPSISLWEQSMHQLLEGFPEDFREMLHKHERQGTTSDKEYQDGMQVFYARHTCTTKPWPQELIDSFATMEEDPTVYQTMIGPSEFYTIGTLRTWTTVDRLHTINRPTLLTNGVAEGAQDFCVMPFFEKIPRIKWVKFAESHIPFFEDKERYFQVLVDFLTAED
ncbi:proline-specific peptidase [Hygrophoropsis aurantiaca]|uniref:Proline-specific peptidase n=1 Tax=Hygrophoropsis aurantiaca TaxID=72124 RepID=A0ACB8AEB1_9AGAM|nr:proline-specific peptidase [Hygrophoropsis aurantiaca]